jgi:hypothetical protein
VQIVGLYKGYQSYGKQSSPFCYAYKRSGNPPFTKDQIEYEYKSGFKRTATWEMAGGVKSWIEGMPENVLANQFPLTPPIFINESLVESFFKQRAIREHEIARAMREADAEWDKEPDYNLLNEVFPQKFDQCSPGWGKGCEFKKLCHGNCTNPLEQGFSWREPHHEKEMEMFESEG